MSNFALWLQHRLRESMNDYEDKLHEERLRVGETKEAFNAYVSGLHQLYLMGAAMQLKRMGYRMTKM